MNLVHHTYYSTSSFILNNMREKEIVEFVKPLYAKKDSMHNFEHVLRIKRKVTELRKDYKRIDEEKLKFLIYFHGLTYYLKEHEKKVIKMGFPKEWIKALYRHTKNPQTIEEKLVSDANFLEAVGRFGIKKALQVGKERNQTMEQTLEIMQQTINKVKFYTKKGKELGNPGIKIVQEFLKSTKSN